ncbi:alpha-L-fucosidase [Kribbella aluminosa]|uniref:alpha-L-fucosidase n=1 Tax=Kribbella aluminosa TaxID=416017 RepID=A0ABS4UWV6_9ACTN|nr:alpha-L-fucosidase [Kribbella aluminosa]MBP2356135.1 alpha-L-fucosidase [Kribbella aluminosa]
MTRTGDVCRWRGDAVRLGSGDAELRFVADQLPVAEAVLVELVVRRDLVADAPDLTLLTVNDLRYERLRASWRLTAGDVSMPVPGPTSAFPQHLAVLIRRVDEAAVVSVWFNGWQVGSGAEMDWPLGGPLVVTVGGGSTAMHGFLTALAVSAVDPAVDAPVFAVADLPANAVPVNPDDSQELLVRKAANVRPTALQHEWQRLGLTAFVHFGMATMTDREGGDGYEDPTQFDPKELDCRQWAQALKRAGFTMAILTAKHADGFLLWPSRYAAHSVAASPWRDGHGDVIREFVDAMRAEGLRVGLYFSPLSRHEMRVVPSRVDGRHHRFGGTEDKGVRLEQIPGPERDVPSDQRFSYVVDEYNAVYLRQLHELLTEYGEIDEVWLDGNSDWFPDDEVWQRFDGRLWYDMARKLQPRVKFFGGWELRWVGNEDGLARDAEWSVLPVAGDLDGNQPQWTAGEPEATVLGDRKQWKGASYFVWHPAEVDVSIRPGWFYHPHERPKSVAELTEIYVRSVGRNCNLLLNIPADRRGLLPEEDVDVLTGFADHRARIFGENVAADLPDGRWSPSAADQVLEIPLSRPAAVRYVDLAEDVTVGQRVESFTVSARAGRDWIPVAGGGTIGQRRIVDLRWSVYTDHLRLEITAARDAPVIAECKVYAVPPDGDHLPQAGGPIR